MRVRLAQAVGRSRMATGMTTNGSTMGNNSSSRLHHPRPSKSNAQRLLQRRRILRYMTLTMALVGMGSLSIMMWGSPHLPKGGGGNKDRTGTTTTEITMNPFYGWQPDDDHDGDTGEGHEMKQPTKACSWRQCFQQEQPQECRSTCREGDMGPAPPLPVPVMPGDEWIPDVTMLHRMMLDGKDAKGRPWPPALDSELCEDIGSQGGPMDVNKELLQKAKIAARTLSELPKTPKIMCMVYTMEANHATNIRAMRETWAPYCDGFLAFSTANDPRIPAISLPHDGPEEYNNMWQKVRSIWKFVGTHYLEDFDFFFQGGEDLFVIPQNLKSYLQQMLDHASMTSDDDFFVGRRFKGYGDKDNYFNSGGAGYALSRGTLRKYVNEGWNHPQCSPDRHTAMEDVMIAECLRNVFNIGLTDTRDDQLRERFHPFAPQSHYQWRPPQQGKRDWYNDYNKEWPPLLNEMCCSPESVSFHYIKKPAMVRHLQALIHTCHK